MAKDKEKVINYTDNDHAIVNALRGTDGLTLAELSDAAGIELKPGHVTSARKKGLIEVIGTREVLRPSVRKVFTYTLASVDPLMNADGKAFSYTEGEMEILKAAAGIDGAFTLADLADAMGRERVTSGSTNGLVRKGNLVKGEPREIMGASKSTVNVYGFVKDIPVAE